jgi:hypothetical protein
MKSATALMTSHNTEGALYAVPGNATGANAMRDGIATAGNVLSWLERTDVWHPSASASTSDSTGVMSVRQKLECYGVKLFGAACENKVWQLLPGRAYGALLRALSFSLLYLPYHSSQLYPSSAALNKAWMQSRSPTFPATLRNHSVAVGVGAEAGV